MFWTGLAVGIGGGLLVGFAAGVVAGFKQHEELSKVDQEMADKGLVKISSESKANGVHMNTYGVSPAAIEAARAQLLQEIGVKGVTQVLGEEPSKVEQKDISGQPSAVGPRFIRSEV